LINISQGDSSVRIGINTRSLNFARWIFQARQMDRDVFGQQLDADQIPFLNPAMVLVFIPLFDYAIYPGVKRCGLSLTPLRRMSAGLFLTALSFVAAGAFGADVCLCT
jgi:dipeptide/tripeptide permease